MSNEYKLVPVEPTDEMIHVGCDSYFDCESSAWSAMAGAYKAMLAAAPQPPALGGEPEAYFADINDLDETGTDKPDFRKVILLSEHRAHLAPLQAEIERWKAISAVQKDRIDVALELAKEHRVEIDQLKARCDELHRMLGLAWGSGDVSAEDCRKIDAALSKPAGSEQV